MTLDRPKTTNSRQDWATPQKLFTFLDSVFDFTLDVCANKENHKCDRFFTIEDDALTKRWTGRCWMNPPYSDPESWVRKAYYESQRGALVVALLPVCTDTRWWREWVTKADIHYIPGRIKFEGADSTAPFACALVLWWPTPWAKDYR